MLSDAEMREMRDNSSHNIFNIALETHLKKKKKESVELIKRISKYPSSLPKCLQSTWDTLSQITSKRHHIRTINQPDPQDQQYDLFDEPHFGLGDNQVQERSPPPEFEIGRVGQSPAPQTVMPWLITF
jgi:hypothetical protein